MQRCPAKSQFCTEAAQMQNEVRVQRVCKLQGGLKSIKHHRNCDNAGNETSTLTPTAELNARLLVPRAWLRVTMC